MKTTIQNPCVRCGTERVVIKTYTERICESTVTTTQMKCPNPECQSIVNKEIKTQEDRKEALRQRANQRVLERKSAKKIKPVSSK